jgi:chemotaxis protein methyltransferase WspC
MNHPHVHHDHALTERFIDLLHRTIGLDAESIGSGAIVRAVRECFTAWRERGDQAPGATLDDYWHAVNADARRLQDLIEAVVVPETWFFRHAEAFSALTRLARLRLHDEPSRPVRVLSLPCSTGEEAYSIAMALTDAGIPPERFSIDAIDVSEAALALARRAQYGRNAFRGHAEAFRGFRERHFERVQDGWRLGAGIAARVRFTQANLLQLDPHAFERFDFVFCRNVLIYFDPGTQSAALRVLDALLAEGGVMFVGPAETGLLMREGMSSAKVPLAFAFRRGEAAARREPWAPAFVAPAAWATTARVVDQVPTIGALKPFAMTPWPAPAASRGKAPLAISLLAPVTPPPAVGDSTLARARALADAGDLARAAAAARRYLEAHAASADAYYLLGVIADARGEAAESRGHYKRALYLDPSHREALTHLAALLQLAGDAAGAGLLLARAERLEARPR